MYMSSVGVHLTITRLPGFHIDCISFDIMHGLHLGVLPVVIGSCMLLLLQSNYFNSAVAGAWHVRFAKQLETAWVRFKDFLRPFELSTSQPKFSVARLTMASLGDPPVWKGKAGDNMIVARWLLHEWLIKARTTQLEADQRVASTLWGYVRSTDILSSAGLFFTDSELEQLEKARAAALECHSLLASDAIASNLQVWRTIPKHHYIDHNLRPSWPDGGRLNPGHQWCFADEDFLGRLIRMCDSRTTSDRIVHKYLLRLHLMIVKGSVSIPQL